jgi:hypothetical protein
MRTSAALLISQNRSGPGLVSAYRLQRQVERPGALELSRSNWQGNRDYFHRIFPFGIDIQFSLDGNDNPLTKSRRSRDTSENADCYRG